MKKSAFVIVAISMTFLTGFLVFFNVVEAQSAVIDEEGITADNESPRYSDSITIEAQVIFIDSKPVHDGVILKWKMCTRDTCEIPTTSTMVDDGTGTFSATIGGPFSSEDAYGNPYLYVGYTVEVTFVPEGGGEQETVKTHEKSIYFDEDTTIPTDDNDTDETDDKKEENNDSTFGMEIALIGMLTAAGIIAYRKRK